MIIPIATLLLILGVPLLGGRLSRLAAVRLRRLPVILLALAAQVAVLQLPVGRGRTAEAVHVASYLAAAAFIWVNRRVPGLLVLAVGAASNGVTIAVNGGVLPADASAMARAGIVQSSGDFVNSGVLDHPRLAFLGDIFAIPAGVPLANVFSVGDVLIVLGAGYAAYRVCGTFWWAPWDAAAHGHAYRTRGRHRVGATAAPAPEPMPEAEPMPDAELAPTAEADAEPEAELPTRRSRRAARLGPAGRRPLPDAAPPLDAPHDVQPPPATPGRHAAAPFGVPAPRSGEPAPAKPWPAPVGLTPVDLPAPVDPPAPVDLPAPAGPAPALLPAPADLPAPVTPSPEPVSTLLLAATAGGEPAPASQAQAQTLAVAVDVVARRTGRIPWPRRRPDAAAATAPTAPQTPEPAWSAPPPATAEPARASGVTWLEDVTRRTPLPAPAENAQFGGATGEATGGVTHTPTQAPADDLDGDRSVESVDVAPARRSFPVRPVALTITPRRVRLGPRFRSR